MLLKYLICFSTKTSQAVYFLSCQSMSKILKLFYVTNGIESYLYMYIHVHPLINMDVFFLIFNVGVCIIYMVVDFV